MDFFEGSNVLTVGEFSALFKGFLQEKPELKNLLLTGEVSDHVHQASGHHYFALRGDDSSVRCAMFKFRSSGGHFLENGAQVVVFGRADYYAVRGSFQIVVEKVSPVGAGILKLNLEKLYKKLSKEGLFKYERKRKPPKFPKLIAVVTSPTGAVQEDIKTTLMRRWPMAKMLLIPTKVQGVDAVDSITKSIEKVGSVGADVCIVARGGGSFEDLIAFNSEQVARAIFACLIPVISAVGHETDTTLADDVADLRAPTPTAAAELATPNASEVFSQIKNKHSLAKELVVSKIENLYMTLKRLSDLLLLSEPMQKREGDINGLFYRLKQSKEVLFTNLENRLLALDGKIKILSPYSTLDRGYAVVFKKGRLAYEKDQFSVGDDLEVKFAKTKLQVKVKTIEEEKKE